MSVVTTTLTAQAISRAGLKTTNVAALLATAGDPTRWANTGKEFIKIVNGGGSPCVVTVSSLVSCSLGSTHNIAVSVAAGDTEYIGPFPTNRFNDANGYCSFTYSQVDTVTVAIVNLPFA